MKAADCSVWGCKMGAYSVRPGPFHGTTISSKHKARVAVVFFLTVLVGYRLVSPASPLF